MEPQAAPFDLSNYEATDTAILTFKNQQGDDDLFGPDGKTPVQARMYSPGSEQGRKALLKSGRLVQLRMFRSMRGDFDPQDGVNAERENAEKLASFTAEFINFPMTPQQVYSNPKLYWMHSQAEAFIGKPGNFSKASSASSTSP